MPFFEYRCNDCKGKFETFTITSKKTDTECTLCGSNRTHKIISPAGIVFKGSGFYINDTRKSSHDNSNDKKEKSEQEIKA